MQATQQRVMRQIPHVTTSNQNDEQVKQATTGHQTSEQQVPPRTTRNQITAKNGPEFENYYMRKERTAAVNDGDNATLKDIAQLQHLMKHLDPQMLPRAQSESDTVRLRCDTCYAVPRQHREGSRDDTSLGLGLKEIPGDNKSLSVSSFQCQMPGGYYNNSEKELEETNPVPSETSPVRCR